MNEYNEYNELYFREKGCPAACTVRSNRTEKAPLKTEKELKRGGRGSMDSVVSSDGILITKWYNNKEVIVASNCFPVVPVTEVRRWDKKLKKYVSIPRPFLIKVYNYGMGGVDRCDQLLAFYRILTKSIKWYKRVLYHFVDLCVVNAYLLWRNAKRAQGFTGRLPLYKFKMEVAKSLMYSESSDNPSLSRHSLQFSPQQDQMTGQHGDPVGQNDVSDSVRLDRHDHLPKNIATRGRM